MSEDGWAFPARRQVLVHNGSPWLLQENPRVTTVLLGGPAGPVLALPAPAGAMPVDARRHVKPRSNAWETKVLRPTDARRRGHGVQTPHFPRIGVSGWRIPTARTYATQDFIG